ncbi:MULTISPECIES: response regulator [unclassified Motilimonas]|uniref:response regulator n=1 Tax=unclassified Motilimonas TaxID=2643697 RepID=UPI001E4C8277|nr:MULTISPECIES: response regulator [unclassified Motilimonas]MCE0558824.1 response regulator [Motilimonas sp. E26]MDO6526535.1 response regulator [Motilimonas sp. 1_MG-2023]
METINIICVDDQREVLSAVVRDLAPLADHFNIEECESAAECEELMDELDADGEHVALVISDHVMPLKTGVQLLTEIADDPRFREVKKILLTGLATHADTIKAVNQAHIDHYLEKAWDGEELLHISKQLLTEYIVSQGLDYQSRLAVLDAPTLYKLIQ